MAPLIKMTVPSLVSLYQLNRLAPSYPPKYPLSPEYLPKNNSTTQTLETTGGVVTLHNKVSVKDQSKDYNVSQDLKEMNM